MKLFFREVNNLLFGKYLFVTNVVSSSILMAVGDGIQQGISVYRDSSNYNFSRMGNMFGIGFLLGPQQHIFYKFIDKKYPSRSVNHICKKLVLDQLILSPIYIVSFFTFANLLESGSIRQCIQEIKSKFIAIYKIDCMIWIPSQMINFWWFSPKYRMLYVNVTTMIYDIFLSHIKHST